jgi:hypothetical protein
MAPGVLVIPQSGERRPRHEVEQAGEVFDASQCLFVAALFAQCLVPIGSLRKEFLVPTPGKGQRLLAARHVDATDAAVYPLGPVPVALITTPDQHVLRPSFAPLLLPIPYNRSGRRAQMQLGFVRATRSICNSIGPEAASRRFPPMGSPPS